MIMFERHNVDVPFLDIVFVSVDDFKSFFSSVQGINAYRECQYMALMSFRYPLCIQIRIIDGNAIENLRCSWTCPDKKPGDSVHLSDLIAYQLPAEKSLCTKEYGPFLSPPPDLDADPSYDWI